jgi:hypothetical protein
MFLGAAVGILIGLISGVATGIILLPILQGPPYRLRVTTFVAGKLLVVIPSCWGGGGWITTGLFAKANLVGSLNSYIYAVLFSWVTMLIRPLLIFNWQLGELMRKR